MKVLREIFYSLQYTDCGAVTRNWPHSTTSNKFGYEACMEMGIVL